MEKIAEGVFCHMAKDTQRKLFDQLVPIPEGTTYNSYLVKGSEKTALIDATHLNTMAGLLADIDEAGIEKIDYIIANHGEQDHTGAIAVLLEKFPEAKVVTNPKCAENIVNFIRISPDRIEKVADSQELDLGGKTLKFIFAPWVHWPDTMFTFIEQDNLLCTCDLFGAHYTEGGLYADGGDAVLMAAKRYFAEIMLPYAKFAGKYVAQIRQMNPRMILPSHGPVYGEPDFILSAYEKWTSPLPANKVVIPFVSMYESTKILVDTLRVCLEYRGIEVKTVDLADTDEGDLAMELVDAATIVIGVSMVLAGPHPRAVYAAYLASILKPKCRFGAIVGSFGWGGKLTDIILNILAPLKLQMLEPVISKGRPQADDLKKIDDLASSIAEKHAELLGGKKE